jgi:hypothetical protein
MSRENTETAGAFRARDDVFPPVVADDLPRVIDRDDAQRRPHTGHAAPVAWQLAVVVGRRVPCHVARAANRAPIDGGLGGKSVSRRPQVAFKGASISVSLDGKPCIEVQDTHIQGAGKAGVWTKADSVTLFDAFAYGP